MNKVRNSVQKEKPFKKNGYQNLTAKNKYMQYVYIYIYIVYIQYIYHRLLYTVIVACKSLLILAYTLKDKSSRITVTTDIFK